MLSVYWKLKRRKVSGLSIPPNISIIRLKHLKMACIVLLKMRALLAILRVFSKTLYRKNELRSPKEEEEEEEEEEEDDFL